MYLKSIKLLRFAFYSLASFENYFNATFLNISQQFQDGLQGSLKEAQKISEELQPFAARTSRLLQEKFGQVDDVSELPSEYLELERKVDNLRVVYKNLLTVTETFEFESYDYPPNLKESFNDVSKSLTGRFYELSKTTTTKEAETLLNSQAKEKSLPKTLAHALSRAAANSRQQLLISAYHAAEEAEEEELPEENPLAKALLKLADTEKLVGEKRLEQDQLIIVDFNHKLNQILTDSFKQTSQNRRKVEKARLDFDTLRTQVKRAEEAAKETEAPEEDKVPVKDVEGLNSKLEAAEDELVSATEEAVTSMKRILDPAESVNLVQVLVKAQLEYFKSVTADLEVLSAELDTIIVEAAESEE
ncbi:hypothetical protein BABINDRAFT_180341 [Babjeviella inositovora NRRL Y-12698]|uniref:BAR domain-containing protein n=1 Tax=Babjeviella inositovora NRRL Y-12698 TaxID=984486 RepID=A0A1E3QQ59_9ASCO|nr:uncharacterized protein BABINDRAFT_180341 [Babjeviella inositovora NRRL Y-12698]ODQ79815.1 hypothetical protein BABINDRAFT_180341 [Babjeviella inositovora NRRL Y-12698]